MIVDERASETTDRMALGGGSGDTAHRLEPRSWAALAVVARGRPVVIALARSRSAGDRDAYGRKPRSCGGSHRARPRYPLCEQSRPLSFEAVVRAYRNHRAQRTDQAGQARMRISAEHLAGLW